MGQEDRRPRPATARRSPAAGGTQRRPRGAASGAGADAADGHLTGMLLVAMPAMADPRFTGTVIYLCAHSSDGAMGLVVNQAAADVTFPSVVEQLGIQADAIRGDVPVHVGGPVEMGRGFVLHSPDYMLGSTLLIDGQFALTATVDVLKAIAEGGGPDRRVLALGYAGWGAGQLDSEIQSNGWMIVPADPELVFGRDNEGKWNRALAKLGIDPRLLSSTAGHA